MAQIVGLENQTTATISAVGISSYFLLTIDEVNVYAIVCVGTTVMVYQLNSDKNEFTLIKTLVVPAEIIDCIYYQPLDSCVAIFKAANDTTTIGRFTLSASDTSVTNIDMPSSSNKYTRLAQLDDRLVAVGDSVLVADSTYLTTFVDYTASDEQGYEYALVPVVGGVEGNYLTISVTSQFDGVFITDGTDIYKFYGDVSYGNFQQVQKVNAHEPFGRKYPVIVSNGATNYLSGSMSGMILAGDYLRTGQIDRRAIANERNTLLKFLTNKKPKILKDWNGNMWMVAIIDNPSVTYYDGSGMGLMSVSTTFMEIGDANNVNDLASHGFAIPEGG